MRTADLISLGAGVVIAVAAAERGDRTTMALGVLVAFWTAVRMVREARWEDTWPR
jgi:hypothetical protein